MGMVVKPAPSISPSLSAIVPPLNQKIEPWKSIIHWTELWLERESGKNRGYTKWIVPVTCGRRTSPDCRGKRDVIVLRGMSGPDMLTPNCLTGRGNIFSGVCVPCLKMKEYPKLTPGSYVCIGDDNEDGTLFKCGGCGKLLRRRLKEPKAFTGLCLSCGQRAAKGSKTIPKGENQGKIPFDCANCGEEAFAWPHQHKSLKWRRLCPKCQKPSGAPPPWGWNAVNKDDVLPLTKAPVYLSRRQFPRPKGGGSVEVQCVFPVSENENGICGMVTGFNFKVLRREWKTATGYCPNHEISGRVDRANAYAIIQQLLSQAQNGNGQKKVAHRERSDRDKWLLEIIAKVAERWRKFPATENDSERRDNLARIKQAYIANDLGITEVSLRDRLKECGLRDMFPSEKKRYPALVAFVADGVDRGDAERKILDDLKRLAVTAAAQ
jgi:hypothetical protein